MISKLKKDDGLEPDPPGMDKELAAAFDKFLKKEMKSLATELQDGELKRHQKSASILDLKYKIFGLCYQKMTDEISSFMPECGHIYSTLF